MNPYIGRNELIRLMGRLQKSNISEHVRHLVLTRKGKINTDDNLALTECCTQ